MLDAASIPGMVFYHTCSRWLAAAKARSGPLLWELERFVHLARERIRWHLVVVFADSSFLLSLANGPAFSRGAFFAPSAATPC
jgi:hypothetical protein